MWVAVCDRFELKPYQLIGLNWLRIMHSQQLNGILADEMVSVLLSCGHSRCVCGVRWWVSVKFGMCAFPC